MNMLLLALLLLPGLAAAQSSKAGTSGAQFLKLGAGARAGGMADAFAAVADDVTAAYYNPAGLTQLKGVQLSGAHTMLFEDVSYDALNFAVPWQKEKTYSRHVLALGIYNLRVSEIERRVSDTTGSIGTFDSSDAAYAVSYAYAFSPRLSAGVTGKYIVQRLDTYNASAAAADAGLHWKPNPNAVRPWTAALVVKNVGNKPEFAGVEDPLPMGGTAAFGWEAIPNALKLDLEATKYRDTDPFASLGAEYRHHFNTSVSGALRGGYTSHYRDNEGLNGVALGGGIQFHKAGFDFAWQPFGRLGNTFRYSLIVKF
jgi:long-subunit fatty acid transport protein